MKSFTYEFDQMSVHLANNSFDIAGCTLSSDIDLRDLIDDWGFTASDLLFLYKRGEVHYVQG